MDSNKEYVARVKSDMARFMETSGCFGNTGSKELHDRAIQVFNAFLICIDENICEDDTTTDKKEVNLEWFFRNNYPRIIDYSLRTSIDEQGAIAFYIHADGKDSDTMDFEVHGNSLIPNPKVQKLPNVQSNSSADTANVIIPKQKD